MKPEPDNRVTQLLVEWSAGNPGALGQLMPLVYEELRLMAQQHLRRERPEHTLQRTALVHEAFLRLVNQRQVRWQSRAQFLGLASQLMRRILVDHARTLKTAKRGSGIKPASLDETATTFNDALSAAADPTIDIAAIDEALTRFEAFDPQQSKIVELRFFGGLSIEDIAPVLGISESTVKREWSLARAWLQRELA